MATVDGTVTPVVDNTSNNNDAEKNHEMAVDVPQAYEVDIRSKLARNL